MIDLDDIVAIDVHTGWSSKYFPVITPDRCLADFEKIDIKPEVRPLILKVNAARLLGLGTH